MILDQNTANTLLQTGLALLYMSETKIIPRLNSSIKIKLDHKLGLAMLKDYTNNLINKYAMFRTHYSQPLFDINIVILNAQLDLNQYTPITKLEGILNASGEIEIDLEPTRIG